MKANEDFLAYAAKEDTEWAFVVPVDAESVAGLLEETLSTVEDCYEVFDGFLSPSKVKCIVRSYERGLSVDELSSVDTGECHDLGMMLSSSDGVVFDEITSIVRGLDESIFPQKFVPTVHFKQMDVRVRLGDGEHDLGIPSALYKDPDSHENPPDPPLEVEVRTHRYADPPEIAVNIFLNTDIWFEDTELGEANRQRLHEFLERMADTLGATEVDYWSNTHAIPFEDLHDR